MGTFCFKQTKFSNTGQTGIKYLNNVKKMGCNLIFLQKAFHGRLLFVIKLKVLARWT